MNFPRRQFLHLAAGAAPVPAILPSAWVLFTMACLCAAANCFAAEPTKQANNPQQSWGFGGEPPEAVMKDSGTRDGTL
jgi:hypothetical protein